MTRGILAAGNESSLFYALCRETAKRVESFAAAPIPGVVEPGAVKRNSQREEGLAKAAVLDWNPSSPISARTLVLAGISKLEHIDEAILVCVPPAYRHPPQELSPVEIDRMVDVNIKSWFFLVKELTAVFKAGKRGTLALVLSEAGSGTGEEAPDLLGSAAAAAFRAFAQGVVIAHYDVPYTVMGFSSSEPGEEEAFASFIFKTLEDGKKGAGRWHKYGKFGLFRR